MHRSIIAASSAEVLDGAPPTIQYLPQGTSTIDAKVDGEAASVEITVDAETAELLQQSLEARQKNNVRAIVDFDHNDTGPAAAIPKRFHWVEGEGVMLDLDYTRSGKAAIEGRDYSYFSPLFMLGEDGKPLGLHPQRPVGGLVNDPAFRNIRRIAAAHAEPSTKQIKKMSDFSSLVECGALTADQAKSDNAPSIIAAAFTAAQKSQTESAEALAAAQAERDAALKIIQASREAEADEAIAKAVEAGRISDTDADKTFWRDLCIEKGAPAIKQLEAKAAAKPGINHPVIKQGGAVSPANAQSVEAARAARVRNRAAEIRNTEGVPFSASWSRANAEIPA